MNSFCFSIFTLASGGRKEIALSCFCVLRQLRTVLNTCISERVLSATSRISAAVPPLESTSLSKASRSSMNWRRRLLENSMSMIQ